MANSDKTRELRKELYGPLPNDRFGGVLTLLDERWLLDALEAANAKIKAYEGTPRLEVIVAERDQLAEALSYIAADPRLPRRLKRIAADALAGVPEGSDNKPSRPHPKGLPLFLQASWPAAGVPGEADQPPVDEQFPFHVEGCICPRFRDIAPTLIADLTCPVHGIDGTDPGDKFPGEQSDE
jgi:hypothetical protein